MTHEYDLEEVKNDFEKYIYYKVGDDYCRRNPLEAGLFRSLFGKNIDNEGNTFTLALINSLVSEYEKEDYVYLDINQSRLLPFFTFDMIARSRSGKLTKIIFQFVPSICEAEKQMQIYEDTWDYISNQYDLIVTPKFEGIYRLVRIRIISDDLFPDDPNFLRTTVMACVRKDKNFNDILPTAKDIDESIEKYGYTLDFQLPKFHKYVNDLKKKNNDQPSWINDLKLEEQWLLFLSEYTTRADFDLLMKDQEEKGKDIFATLEAKAQKFLKSKDALKINFEHEALAFREFFELQYKEIKELRQKVETLHHNMHQLQRNMSQQE